MASASSPSKAKSLKLMRAVTVGTTGMSGPRQRLTRRVSLCARAYQREATTATHTCEAQHNKTQHSAQQHTACCWRSRTKLHGKAGWQLVLQELDQRGNNVVVLRKRREQRHDALNGQREFVRHPAAAASRTFVSSGQRQRHL